MALLVSGRGATLHIRFLYTAGEQANGSKSQQCLVFQMYSEQLIAHVTIREPQQGDVFESRKHFHFFNIQIILDVQMVLTNDSAQPMTRLYCHKSE